MLCMCFVGFISLDSTTSKPHQLIKAPCRLIWACAHSKALTVSNCYITIRLQASKIVRFYILCSKISPAIWHYTDLPHCPSLHHNLHLFTSKISHPWMKFPSWNDIKPIWFTVQTKNIVCMLVLVPESLHGHCISVSINSIAHSLFTCSFRNLT